MSPTEAKILAMPAKEQIRALLDTLPHDCTIEDMQYGLYVIQRIRHGLESADRGEIISHEEVKLQMQKWLKK